MSIINKYAEQAIAEKQPYSPQALRVALEVWLVDWDRSQHDEDIVMALDEAHEVGNSVEELPYDIQVDELLDYESPGSVATRIINLALYLTGKSF
jgi:hypothetical protein